MEFKVAFFGVVVLSLCTLSYVRGQCDSSKVLDCSTTYLDVVRKYSAGETTLENLCDKVEVYLSCTRSALDGCGSDVKDQMEQTLQDAKRKMRDAGCTNISGGGNTAGSLVHGSGYLCFAMAVMFWFLRKQ